MSALGAEGAAMGFLPPITASRALRHRAPRRVLAVRSPADGDGDDFAATDDPQLPPLRLPTSYASFGGALASPGSSSSSDAFVSMSSTPSVLLLCLASSSELEFGTAREYDTTDLFFGENWLYDNHLFHGKLDGDRSDEAMGRTSSLSTLTLARSITKCVSSLMVAAAAKWTGCSMPTLKAAQSCIPTLQRHAVPAMWGGRTMNWMDVVLKGEQAMDSKGADDELLDMSTVEKELQCSVRIWLKLMLLRLSLADPELEHGFSCNDPKTDIDLAFSRFHQEYEVFELRIFHRKNRTGFEETKEFPIVMDSVVAGRYRITEYLGSAAFSKSLDEIKLLKFVNKYDPDDEHHILRLYDFFYYQEHLFIVTELLRANLYEFQNITRSLVMKCTSRCVEYRQ
ncbi:hypothetical protein GUJ93_ZPchr0005g14755 [Zizania palustris]|uniref:Uncharacterized protein n=1 Tax=Zizania palustris TaxID=103762 RepID=A0A8J5SP15_ZIZPA|nr:hypothetical protein GUJ93_ZPchr0005g14755 [Zizania palustris]